MVFTFVQRLFQSFKYSKEPIFNSVKRFVAGNTDLNMTAPTSSPPQLYRDCGRYYCSLPMKIFQPCFHY